MGRLHVNCLPRCSFDFARALESFPRLFLKISPEREISFYLDMKTKHPNNAGRSDFNDCTHPTIFLFCCVSVHT